MTYTHYGSPDEVARRWIAAAEAHAEFVAVTFSALRAGEITMEEADQRVTMIVMPVSDQDLESMER